MMKFLAILCVFTILFALAACGSAPAAESTPEAQSATQPETAPETVSETKPETASETEPESTTEEPDMLQIEIIIADKTFSATLYESETAKALYDMLPVTLSMSELNGNEKYYYLGVSLPTDPSKPDRIRTGDLMLYGDDCLVLFYDSFSTSYSYTPIGYADDPAGLAAALGDGSAVVTFKK